MSDEARIALRVLWPAMTIAAALLLIAWQPWRRGARQISNAYWAAPIALAIGAAVALGIVTNWQALELKHRWHWLGPIALAAGALGLVAALWRPAIWWRVTIGAAMAFAAAALFQPPPIYDHPKLWKAGLGTLVFIMWINLEPLASRRAGASLPIAMTVAFTGVSIVLIFTNQAGFSLLAAAMSAMCGVALVIALLNPHFTFAHGGTHVIATMMPALVVFGWLWNPSDVPAGPFVVALAAPLFLWIGEMPAVSRRGPWQAVAIRAAAVAVPVAVAIIWAMASIDDDAMDYR